MTRPGLYLVSLTLALLAGCEASETEPAGPWSRAGAAVAEDQIESSAGPAHCGWKDAHFLWMAWPPGSVPEHRADTRAYVRDPEGVLPERQVQGTLQPNAELPVDALATGYENDGWELWLAPGDEDATAYLVTGDGGTVEAWPRETTRFGCG